MKTAIFKKLLVALILIGTVGCQYSSEGLEIRTNFKEVCVNGVVYYGGLASKILHAPKYLPGKSIPETCKME
jgi:hypothetical protein